MPHKARYNIGIDENERIEYTKRSSYRTQKENTTPFELKSFRGLGPKIWALIQNQSKRIQSLNVFKDKLKEIEFVQSFCNICREFTMTSHTQNHTQVLHTLSLSANIGAAKTSSAVGLCFGSLRVSCLINSALENKKNSC